MDITEDGVEVIDSVTDNVLTFVSRDQISVVNTNKNLIIKGQRLLSIIGLI